MVFSSLEIFDVFGKIFKTVKYFVYYCYVGEGKQHLKHKEEITISFTNIYSTLH